MITDLTTPLSALRVALGVIESYQVDIRNSEDIIGIDLYEKGFCQGVYYTTLTVALRKALNNFEQEEKDKSDARQP